MLYLKQNARVALILVHEIYGVNEHIAEFGERLALYGFDVLCPSLLNVEEPFNYNEEKEAYRHFMTQVGFPTAKDKLMALLQDIRSDYTQLFLVGFSIGATVAWLCSEEGLVDGVIGFYGSRIRDYTELMPKCPVLLFFGEEEPSFNVDDLLSALKNKEKIFLEKYKAKHGFCDPASPYYNDLLAKMAFAKMVDFINGLIKKVP